MSQKDILKSQLQNVLDLIEQERNLAKQLKVNEMLELTAQKADAIQKLKGLRTKDEEVLELAAQVEHENRRNAYLFWFTLNWVRDCMSFVAQTTKTPQYTAKGNMDKSLDGGIVLSGKV